MKVTVPLLKSILAPLGITGAASAIDAEIQKKIHGSGTATSLILNKEMKDIMEIFHALEDSNILFKGVTWTIKNETKQKKRILRNTCRDSRINLARKSIISERNCVRAGSENEQRNWFVRAGYGKQWDF